MSTTDDFTEAARAEAERMFPPPSDRARPAIAERMTEKRIGFEAGAEWAASREYTDAEVEAAAQELWKHRALGTVHPNYPWSGLAPELRQSLRELARAALSAARAARRDEEKK